MTEDIQKKIEAYKAVSAWVDLMQREYADSVSVASDNLAAHWRRYYNKMQNPNVNAADLIVLVAKTHDFARSMTSALESKNIPYSYRNTHDGYSSEGCATIIINTGCENFVEKVGSLPTVGMKEKNREWQKLLEDARRSDRGHSLGS